MLVNLLLNEKQTVERAELDGGHGDGVTSISRLVNQTLFVKHEVLCMVTRR